MSEQTIDTVVMNILRIACKKCFISEKDAKILSEVYYIDLGDIRDIKTEKEVNRIVEVLVRDCSVDVSEDENIMIRNAAKNDYMMIVETLLRHSADIEIDDVISKCKEEQEYMILSRILEVQVKINRDDMIALQDYYVKGTTKVLRRNNK